MTEAYKIRHARISNFRRIEFADLPLNEQSVELLGRNGQGKSSIIDAIWIALTGKNIPANPIHEGAQKAEISLEFGTYSVIRSLTKSGQRLEVKADGVVQKSPQALLDKIIGDISFDPFEFISMQPAKQKALLMEILGINFDDIEIKKRNALNKANDAERNEQSLRGELARLGPIPEEPVDAVDTDAMQAQAAMRSHLERAAAEAAHKADYCAEKLRKAKEKAEQLRSELEAINISIRDMEEESVIAQEYLESANSALADAPNLADTIRTAQEANKIHDAQVRRNELREQLANAQKEKSDANADAKKCDAEKVQRIQSAQFPVDGLGFSDDGVTWNGLEFSEDQISKAKIIEIGLGIAISLNPGARIARIRDGSLLDDVTKPQIIKLCHQHGFQAFIESVAPCDLSAEIIEESEE